jgi:drug/metabolite transporter (DMT)-like permease
MVNKQEFEKGAFYMLLSAFTLSLFTLFSKFGTEGTPYFLLVFLRFAVPFLLILPLILCTTSLKDMFSKIDLKIQLLRSAFILLNQYSIFYYLIYSSVLDATVIQNTAPLLIPILERVFFKHRFEKKTIISILISFVGVLCILQPSRAIFGQLSIAALLIPFGQAGSQVLYSHQAKSENAKYNLFFLFFIGTAASGIVFLFCKAFFDVPGSLKGYTVWMWSNLLLLAVASVMNQTLRGISYRHGKASALSPFLYASIVFSAIIDWVVFHRIPSWLSVLGALLVLVGGMIMIQHHKRKKAHG